MDNYQGKWASAIDGRPIWGADGELPKVEVVDINITIDGNEVPIHKVFFSDIYECTNNFEVYKNGDTYFVYQRNSDGAGSYEIVWVLDKTGLKQRLVGTII